MRNKQFDHNSPDEVVNGKCYLEFLPKKFRNATVIVIPLQSRGKKDSIRRGNININSRLLEEESGKHDLYFLKHSRSWLNVDQSLNMDLFYEDVFHFIKEGNKFLDKKIMIFIKNCHPLFVTRTYLF